MAIPHLVIAAGWIPFSIDVIVRTPLFYKLCEVNDNKETILKTYNWLLLLYNCVDVTVITSLNYCAKVSYKEY